LFNTFDKRAVIDDIKSPLNIIIEANDDAFGVIGFDEVYCDVIKVKNIEHVCTLNSLVFLTQKFKI